MATVTHGFNQSQRFIGREIVGRDATSIQVEAAPGGNMAPSGCTLFIVNRGRAPSPEKWIQPTP